MARSVQDINSDRTITILPSNPRRGCKAVVQVSGVGVYSISFGTRLAEDARLDSAANAGTSYTRPSSPTTVETAAITGPGIYEFILDGKLLDLVVDYTSGDLDIAWEVVDA